jgi:hypothetical protein
MITMVLGGLWHGASWVFLVWGGLHGLALAIDRALQRLGRMFSNPALRSFSILALIHFVAYPILYFRYTAGILELEQYLSYVQGNTLLLMIWTGLLILGYLGDLLSGNWPTFGVSRRVSVIMVFHFVCFGWIFFRSGALGANLPPLVATNQVLSQIASTLQPQIFWSFAQAYATVLLLILLGFVLHYLPQSWYHLAERQFTRSPIVVKSLSLALLIWLVIQTASSDVVPFIYFQF